MGVRILHCSTNIENYNLCVKHKVAGFLNRSPQTGDLIYLVVKVDNESLCGARGILGEVTDNKPWVDADRFVHCLNLKNIEYCKPFDVSILSKTGGKYWYLKSLRDARELDTDSSELLRNKFIKNKSDTFFLFSENTFEFKEKKGLEDDFQPYDNEPDDFEPYEIDHHEYKKILKEFPDAKIKILGTFLTINFINETDKFRGLETLVNENFHLLFTQYPNDRSILIPENRKFETAGTKVRDKSDIPGIKSIPDAILLVYDKNSINKLNIYIIEYKCYGERKYRSIIDKSNFFNGTILPQTMKYASQFSIVTDKQIREETIHKWSKIIIDYLFEHDELQLKFTSWIKDINPNINVKKIAYEINNLLHNAFRNNIKIMLIIDDLSIEQKDTLKNVIHAFKLETGASINFIGHVVKLVQRINIITKESEYALTVQ